MAPGALGPVLTQSVVEGTVKRELDCVIALLRFLVGENVKVLKKILVGFSRQSVKVHNMHKRRNVTKWNQQKYPVFQKIIFVHVSSHMPK